MDSSEGRESTASTRQQVQLISTGAASYVKHNLGYKLCGLHLKVLLAKLVSNKQFTLTVNMIMQHHLAGLIKRHL